MQFLRINDVAARLRRSRSRLFADIRAGLMPPGVSLGARCTVYPVAEIDAVVAARLAGKDEAAIRALVRDLIAQRKAAA